MFKAKAEEESENKARVNNLIKKKNKQSYDSKHSGPKPGHSSNYLTYLLK